ncbi:MAG: phenylalanine--tRNA ligase subunit beta [Candidatus Chisholmbacteria bacterium]|nr:phenylalanine--tRNA ligase subunit beta [Candidatus Chisholmbacteria bacterium]
MNLLVPHSWLLEHLDTKAKPADIQRYLSLCGPSVEQITQVDGEPIYHIEVTTNRVDMMSVYGIAREAAAILPQFKIKASLKKINHKPFTISHKPLDITIKNNPHLCHRILAIKLSDVKLGPSPKWLQDRLIQIGQRPLNNIIDITNFCMWELGHPVHAFDYDRLKKKTVIVRTAKKGERLTTLDDKTHTLKGGEVVFDDGTGQIIDLPGIMGTQNTVVTHTTKNVLLWIESIVPEKIRLASMGLNIRSQAAILNEKGVDPELGLTAILQSIKLSQTIAGAQVASRLVDIYPYPPKSVTTTLNQQTIDTYLGIHLEPKKITKILTSLGCIVNLRSNIYYLTPPSWRSSDLLIPQDYIEEITRIYGYHNLPSILMATSIPDNPPDDNFQLEHQIKTWLADWGLTEIYTYSLVAQPDAKNNLKLTNPLTDDMIYLRQSLISSHLQVINQNKNKKDISIFEMANVYLPKPKNLPEHQLRLTLTTTQDYAWLKGIIEALFQKLHLPSITFKPTANSTAAILSHTTQVGTIGIVTPSISAADLDVKTLISLSSLYPHYQPLPTTAPIIEDVTITLSPQTYLGPVITAIKSVSPLIESVTLKDRYQDNFTFTITYRHPKNQLTDQDIAPLRAKITTKIHHTPGV